MSGLKKRLDFAYKMASKEARRHGRRHKKAYDLKVRESQLRPGDSVLLRNLGLKGKNKLADKWEKDVYLVVDQPNKRFLSMLSNENMEKACVNCSTEISSSHLWLSLHPNRIP